MGLPCLRVRQLSSRPLCDRAAPRQSHLPALPRSAYARSDHRGRPTSPLAWSRLACAPSGEGEGTTSHPCLEDDDVSAPTGDELDEEALPPEVIADPAALHLGALGPVPPEDEDVEPIAVLLVRELREVAAAV